MGKHGYSCRRRDRLPGLGAVGLFKGRPGTTGAGLQNTSQQPAATRRKVLPVVKRGHAIATEIQRGIRMLVKTLSQLGRQASAI